MSKILIGSDHAGYTLKTAVKEYLQSLKYEVLDLGTTDKSSCHYPDFAAKMAAVIKPEDHGILICGSGIGIGIAANKCGLPCATAYNEFTAAEVGRNFQVMALGERVVPIEVAKLMIQAFLHPKKWFSDIALVLLISLGFKDKFMSK